jgi:hypothetical protein
MDGTHELVDAAQFGRALLALSALGAVLALALLLIDRKRPSMGRRRAALLSAVGALVYPLWLVYNGIEDRFGLDSVAALLINLALFAAVGIAGGRLLRRLWR